MKRLWSDIMSINDFQLTNNFNLSEFECTHPEHRHVQVDTELVDKLQKLRKRLGLPMVINSDYRCPERNKQVGGADRSQHLLGKAVDISLDNQKLNIETISDMAKKIGFKGIGLYDTFIHLDVRNNDYVTKWDKRL